MVKPGELLLVIVQNGAQVTALGNDEKWKSG